MNTENTEVANAATEFPPYARVDDTYHQDFDLNTNSISVCIAEAIMDDVQLEKAWKFVELLTHDPEVEGTIHHEATLDIHVDVIKLAEETKEWFENAIDNNEKQEADTERAKLLAMKAHLEAALKIINDTLADPANAEVSA